MTTAIGGILWLFGLYVAAPMLRPKRGGDYTFPDRLRDALILGVAIPFVLGIANLLYPAACWALLGVCLALAYRKRGEHASSLLEPAPFITIAALALVAWPQLARPVLDGDSLTYHLPNAASWVQTHGVWTTATRYWWYPPASEMFASALYAVAGPYAVGWSGFGALALVGFRIADWARREFGAPPWLADAVAAAVVTAMPLALQGGTLQNDVWQATFWLETLWLIRLSSPLALASIAMCVLCKPYGWILALIALISMRARAGVWIAAAGAAALWIARDAALWAHAVVPPSSTAYGNLLATSIAAHGLPALLELVRVAVAESPIVVVALAWAIVAPFALPKASRALGWCALAAVATFVALPFGFDNGDAQLATGESLRFGAPAIVLGGLLLVVPARRAAAIAAALLFASAAFGAAMVVAIFSNDRPTLAGIAAAAIVTVAIAAARARNAPWAGAAGLAIAMVAAMLLAQRQPLDFYADTLQFGPKKSGIYTWIATTRPAVVGGWGLQSGVLNVLSPSTRTIDLPDADPCAEARTSTALLVAVAQTTHDAQRNASTLAQTRACGTILYDDGIAVVADPKP
jgi:hypothetical protein